MTSDWADMVKPVVQKCRLANKLDMGTRFNTDGSEALARLLDEMAKRLDAELDRQRRMPRWLSAFVAFFEHP